MRTLLAVALSLHLAFVALAPHLHAGAHGVEECPVCVASGRGAEPAATAVPDLEPRRLALRTPAAAPGASPVCGAPLGAIPGQSPPRA